MIYIQFNLHIYTGFMHFQADDSWTSKIHHLTQNAGEVLHLNL